MSVKIRLQRRGRRKKPFYHIVVADSRAPRDGRFIEKIGSYNPMTKPATIELDRDRAYEWLMKGAQPTDTARAILRFKGVMYRKHLMRGVKKGALTQEQADEMYTKWIEAKEARIAERFEETRKEREAFHQMIFGKIKPVQENKAATAPATEGGEGAEEAKSFAESVEQTTVESFSEGAETTEAPAEAVNETAAETVNVDTPAEEAAPAAEATPVVEEAPAAETTQATTEEVAVEAPAAEETTETATAEPDDLTKIEGIGPKIAEVMNGAGINTFAEMAAKSADELKAILTNAEGNFAAHTPDTWPKQAEMAAAGQWDELKKWQDELDGGKVVE